MSGWSPRPSHPDAIFPGVPKQYKLLGLALGALGWNRVCAVRGPGLALRHPAQIRGGTGTRALGAVVAPAPVLLCKEPSGAAGDPLSLHRLKRRELNCYMYAPKDELKHRLLWREPYTEHEAGRGSAGPRMAAAGSAGGSKVCIPARLWRAVTALLAQNLPIAGNPRPCRCKEPPRPHRTALPTSPPSTGSSPRGSGNMFECARAWRPLQRALYLPRVWKLSPGYLQVLSPASRCPQILPFGPLWFHLPPPRAHSTRFVPSPHAVSHRSRPRAGCGVCFCHFCWPGHGVFKCWGSAPAAAKTQAGTVVLPSPAGQGAQELVREPHARPKGWRAL